MKKENVDVEHVLQESKDKGKGKEISPANTSTTASRDGLGPGPMTSNALSHVKGLIGMPLLRVVSSTHATLLLDYCVQRRCGTPSFHHTQNQGRFHVWIVIGKERFDLPTTYGSAEEGHQRVAKQVLARLSKGSPG